MKTKKSTIVAMTIVLTLLTSSMLFPIDLVKASDPQDKIVYVVIGVDTEMESGHSIYLGSSNPHPTFGMSEYAVFPSGTIGQIFDNNFRNSHRDPSGNSFKMTWYAEMDYVFSQASFVYGDGSPAGVFGYTAVRDLLLKNWGTQIQTYGDSIEYHHHFVTYDGVWDRYDNGPDAEYPDYQNYALDRMIIDRSFYPSSFRSGWNIQSPALSDWLEQWIPFDYSPLGGRTFPQQASGGNRWQQESWDGVSDGQIDACFATAKATGSAIYSFYTHDNMDMQSIIATLQNYLVLADNDEVSYPGVTFKYVTAREAMQLALGFTDFTAPTFTVTPSGSSYTIVSSEPIWANHPYVALKYWNGTYAHVATAAAGTNTWTFTLSNSAGLINMGIAANDLYGNSGVWVNSTISPPTESHGVISLTFDDGWQNQYDIALPLLQARGMKATFYVTTDQILSNDPSFMSIGELQALQNYYGMEIGSHSRTHAYFTTLSDSSIHSECQISQQVLQSYGLSANNFAYPFGDRDDRTDAIVDDYYRSARTVWNPNYVLQIPYSQFLVDANPGETGNPDVLSYLEWIVDQAYSSNSWAVLYFHHVLPGVSDSPSVISTQDFELLLDYIIYRGLVTVTVSQALNLTSPPSPPPSVTISPISVGIHLGESKTFSSSVSGGNPSYSYQWYLNDTAQPGATSNTWTFTPTSTGNYKVYLNVTDALNYRVKSNSASLTVYSQPSAVISPTSISMTIGNTQQFTSSVAGGLIPYTYQWYYANDTAILGATSSILAYKANFTGTYNIYLNVTDALNYRVKSNSASLTVYSQPSAVISPTSISMTIGNTQQFTSSVAGGLIPYTYQWYYANDTAILGATSSILAYKANFTGTYNIYLNVTDALNYRVKSNSASLTVYSQPSAVISPTSISMTIGNTQQFTSSVAGGLIPYTYQWYYANDTAILGATSSILAYKANFTGTYNIYLNVTDALNYRVKSNLASLTVYSQPSAVISPTSISMTIGNTQQFTSSVAGGLIPYTYQWYYANDTAILGATSSILAYKANFTGTYNIYLNVTDALNYRVKSNTVTLNIYSQLTATISPTSVILYYGQSQTFSVSVNGGSGTYTYQWYINDTAVPGATYVNLIFAPRANGNYRIHANVTDSLGSQAKSNVAGDISVFSVYLILNTEPSTTYSSGQQVSLTVTVMNQQNPKLETTLSFTITGPGGYVFYDFQPISASANGITEYVFNWVVPNVAGTYMVETSLVPTQLTAYDARLLQAGESLTGSGYSPVNGFVVLESLGNGIFAFLVLVGSQSLIGVCGITLPKFKIKKL